MSGDEGIMELEIRDEFIKLGQALKLAGIVGSGVEAKSMIEEGLVLVNGELETRRGKKLRDGDEVSAGGNTFVIRAMM
jgi:ribosome-associated protein